MKRLRGTIGKCRKGINGIAIGLMSAAMCTTTALAGTGVSGGALTEAAKQGADGISDEAKSMLPYLLVIVFVIAGLALILTGRRGKESVKELAPQVIVGVCFIVFGASIAAWVFGLFKG